MGDTRTADVPPVPANPTTCGVLLAASLKVIVPVRRPVAVGVKVTDMVQVPEPARLVPQVLLEMAKSPALVPPTVMLLIARATGPLFANVTDCAALVAATAVAGKFRLVGVTVALEAMPLPDNAAD